MSPEALGSYFSSLHLQLEVVVHCRKLLTKTDEYIYFLFVSLWLTFL